VKPSFPKFQLAMVLILAAVSAGAIAVTHWALKPAFYFEVSMRSPTAGTVQTFYDIGRGINEHDSVRLPVRGGESNVIYRFRLSAGEYRTIRFDPIDHGDCSATIRSMRIVEASGQLVRDLPLKGFQSEDITGIHIANGEMHLDFSPANSDPKLILNLAAPMALKPSLGSLWQSGHRTFLRWFLALGVGGGSWLLVAPKLGFAYMHQGRSRLATWTRVYPRRALLVAASLSVAVSCYPIIFFGRSYVGANIVPMLYASAPTLPGSDKVETEDFRGADAGAMMWCHLPYSFVQSRALAYYGELPLWNRYSSCGTTLLGQGQSMFGDPLHMIVLAGKGASWAWDLKYLLAKVLFCWALGLGVLASAKHFLSALLLTCSSAFIGFFSYRFDHPAFFSMCYAPWLLLCWIEITHAATRREAGRWIVLLLFASWAELNSGTVKEAYMLLLSLHGCGLLVFLLATKANLAQKLLDLTVIGAAFFLLSAPVWFTLWRALTNSYSNYRQANAFQIQPGMLVGLFDDIFYRVVNARGAVFNPAANFFILLGCIFATVYLRILLRDRLFVAVGIGALTSFALAFGVVPSAMIKAVPILNNVWHLDNTFSCALIIELVVLAGFGLRCYFDHCIRGDWQRDFSVLMLVLFALFSAYLGLTNALQRQPNDFAPLVLAGRDTFFLLYTLSLVVALVALPWLGRMIILRSKMTALAALLAFLCFVGLHWRNGFQLNSGIAQIDGYVVNPTVRIDLHAPSAAITFLKNQSDVFRTAGFGNNFFPGYNAMPGLEAICGPDALINPYYRELLLAGGVKSDMGWRWVVEKADLESTLPVYDLLNVRYFLDAPQSAQRSIPPLTHVTSLDLDVYKNNAAWPRAFFVTDVRVYDNLSEFLQMVRGAGGHPLAAIQKKDVTDASQVTSDFGPFPRVTVAHDYRLTNNMTTFTVEAPRAGVAVLSESYLPGDFMAQVNGVRTDYFRINYAFRGIKIPAAGTYVISFYYWPKHFTASLLISAGGAVLLVAWLITMFWQQKVAAALKTYDKSHAH